MTLAKTVLPLILCAVTMSAAQASDGVAGTVDLGTTGLGLHLTTALQQNLNLRIGVDALNYSYNTNTDNADYRLKLKLRAFDALLDFYPMSGSQFRVSAGAIYNNNKIEAHGVSNAVGTYTFNGNTYTAADAGSVDGQLTFRKFAPYAGIGYGNALAGTGWNFSTDLGVMFQGRATTTLSNSGCTLGPACDRLATDIAVEAASLNDKGSDLRYFPVVRVGISHAF